MNVMNNMNVMNVLNIINISPDGMCVPEGIPFPFPGPFFFWPDCNLPKLRQIDGL